MDLSLINTSFGYITLVTLIGIYAIGASNSPLGAVSLPCMTMLTSFIYFYLMPVVALAGGDRGFFGMYITSLYWTHAAVLLYALGAGAAFLANRRKLAIDPALNYRGDPQINSWIYFALWGICAAGVIAQVAMGKLNLVGSENYVFAADEVSSLAFVTQAYNLLVPLVLIHLVQNNFRLRSFIVFAIVLVIFLQAGFRFRIMILLAATVTAYALTRAFRLRSYHVAAGTLVALFLVNLIGAVRRYGQGINLSGLTQEKIGAMSNSFGGEFGIVYVLNYTANNPLPPSVGFEPWVVAIARMVPSFLWPDKPVAAYTKYFVAGATVHGAEFAGIAAPQHVEMMLQFGWLGLAPLAFLYFSIAALIIGATLHLPRSARIAVAAIAPSYFGFYMQTRGYFFQTLVDGMVMIGPLFLVAIGARKGPNLATGYRRFQFPGSLSRPSTSGQSSIGAGDARTFASTPEPQGRDFRAESS